MSSIESDQETKSVPRGRPREFELARSLDAAITVFWSKGYEGASIDELTRAMGVPRATLYQVFDDKEGLFLAAVGHYAQTRTAPVLAMLETQGDLRDDLAAFFKAVVDLALSEPDARGCLISCVLADAAGGNLRLRSELDRRFAAMEQQIGDRLAADLNQQGEIQTRALVIASMARGLMLRARAGTERMQLEKAATEAVRVLVDS